MEINFKATPSMEAEIKRLLEQTDLRTHAELFRRAFTLLRIHIDAKQNNDVIKLVRQEGSDAVEYEINLPFKVKAKDETK